MPKIQTSVPRGMLFIYDRNTEGIVIPEYSPKFVVNSTPTSLSIATQSEEDGEVEIDLLPLSCFSLEEKSLVFEGKLMSADGCISICFMADEEIASISSKRGACTIKIAADSPQFPTAVSVYVEQQDID
ncbi:hypothetical protein [Hyphomonas jannaschiana]|uniref:Uncharacterized protein n=1 Tax=Hyphomonas jannaschiana VP2 TaxID=1280952 RepID=A0A059F6W8_9PROT|nr:hypothetical protein [Hyphomonas jannaschiana]KCZ83914.1 hypothetical protein HJA_16530 [Hyphomonas jannaschiana VP2]